MSESSGPLARSSKYKRARIRNFLFTIGPNRLTGGRLARRHLAQPLAIREIDVFSPHWPAAFDGLRIGHVSDFHLGELLPIDKALEVVQQLHAQQPDFIACTGDVVDLHHSEARPLMEALARTDAPLGSALVLGNHDHLHDGRALARLAEAAGLRVLHNEAMVVNHKGEKLTIGGIDWAPTAVQCAKLVDAACGDFVHLLMAHNPKAFLRASDLAIPLTLSGHTHGGQVAMKNRPTTNLAMMHRHRAGLYDANGSRLYVTSGVGSWFPLRVNCPPEIAMLTLRKADVPAEQAAVPARKKRRSFRLARD